MATNITLVALAQMVDISINVKDGIINFQALHTLLHVVIQQLNLNDVAVEFRGDESERIQQIISSLKPGSHLYPEYGVVGQKGKPKPINNKKKQISLQDVVKQAHKEERKEREIRVIERRKDSREDPDQNPLPLKSPQASLSGITPADVQTVVLIESQSQLPQFSVAVSKAVFEDLQNEMLLLKEQVRELTDLPGNMSLLDASRAEGSTPILEMFNILNLTKRMDAAEIAVEKMGSLITDLARQNLSPSTTDKINELREALEPPRKRSSLNGLELRLTALEKTVQQLSSGYRIPGSILEGAEAADLLAEKDAASARTPDDLHSTATQQSEAASVSKARRGSPRSDQLKLFMPQSLFTSVVENLDVSGMAPNDALVLVQQEFLNLRSWILLNLQDVDKVKVFGSAESEATAEALDTKFKEYAKHLDDIDALYKDQIGQLYEQFQSIKQEMTDVTTKLEFVLPGGDSTGIDAEHSLDLANKLHILEREIVAIGEQAAKLREDQEEQDKQTETILEQIDVLKIVKANREDLEDALGDKADACMINRKVSHDQFDAACDDLSRGIEEALQKLEEQEDMWHQALEAIQREIGNKLDKNEVDPIRDFVNSKLKALQEKFKSLAALKKEHEAAGTKSKFLRNVNCISCDKDVVMRTEMDPSLKPQPYAMPPSRSMAPYLAYELDQLRKQQKCTPGSKNLNYIENALKPHGTKDKDHICNRYCGGSHTVTTPQQRVTRLGHFLEQWGPEIAPLNDEYIRGKDNQMYRARDENVYKKLSSASEAKKQSVVSKDVPPTTVPVSEEPQLDRDNLVNKMIEEAAAKDSRDKSDEADKRSLTKKFQNIGAVPLENKPSPQSILADSPNRSPRTSRVRLDSKVKSSP